MIDYKTATLEELLGNIEHTAVDNNASVRTQIASQVRSTIEMREGLDELTASLNRHSDREEVTGSRIWWLNLVLTAATVVLALHSALQIFEFFASGEPT